MRKSFKIVIVGIFLTIFSHSVLAANSLNVVINEIAWMGAETGWYYEWIELSNNTDQEIGLSGWKIDNGGKKNETLEIPEGKIPPKGYFLICKREIEKCDFTTWDLSLHNDYNQNGKLILKNKAGVILDETPEPSDSKWPAGDKESYKTMERKSLLISGNNLDNWQTSQNPGGTPKAENRLTAFQPPEEILPETELEPAPESQKETEEKLEPIAYPSDIFINEVLPSPEGFDAENEWIEIFNGNSFEVDVSGWQIRYTIGTPRTYVFTDGTKIRPNEFLVLHRPQTKIILKNDGDTLELLNPAGEVIDKVNYQKAPLGQSFNKTSSGWTWSTVLTPGETNIITALETQETGPSQISKERESQTKSSQSAEEKEGKKLLTAGIGEKLPEESSNSLIIFLTAIGIAIVSAVIVLILKRRLLGEGFKTDDRGF